MKSVLIAALVSLVVSILCTPVRDPGLPAPRLRAGDPRRRPADPPRQARHAHHGRRRDHHRRRCSATRWRTSSSPSSRRRADPPRRACSCSTSWSVLGLRRVSRRLHQVPQTAQPRPEQDGPSSSASSFAARELRRPGPAVPQRTDTSLRPRCICRSSATSRAISFGSVGFVIFAVPADQRLLQRRQPHRRTGRAGRRQFGDGASAPTSSSASTSSATPAAPSVPSRRLLHRARPARPRPGRRRRDGRVLRIPLVERLSGPDHHGRHRFARAGRTDGRDWRSCPAPSSCWSSSAGCSSSRRCRWCIQVAVFKATRKTGVQRWRPSITTSSSPGGQEIDRHRPVLDHHRAGRGLRDGALLRRVHLATGCPDERPRRRSVGSGAGRRGGARRGPRLRSPWRGPGRRSGRRPTGGPTPPGGSSRPGSPSSPEPPAPPDGTELVVTSPGLRPDAPAVAPPPPPPASRSSARSSSPGGCGRPAPPRGSRSPERTARPRRSACSRRSCGPPACARSRPATSASRWSMPSGRPAVRRPGRGAVQLPAALDFDRFGRPAAAVLNLAPDHLDWHGSMRRLRRRQGRGSCATTTINVVERRRSRGARGSPPVCPTRSASPSASPGRGQVGVVAGDLVDRAFGIDRGTEQTVLARRGSGRAPGRPAQRGQRAGRRRAGPRLRRDRRRRPRRPARFRPRSRTATRRSP